MSKLSINPKCSIYLEIFWSFSLCLYALYNLLIVFKTVQDPTAAYIRQQTDGRVFENCWLDTLLCQQFCSDKPASVLQYVERWRHLHYSQQCLWCIWSRRCSAPHLLQMFNRLSAWNPAHHDLDRLYVTGRWPTGTLHWRQHCHRHWTSLALPQTALSEVQINSHHHLRLLRM